MTTCLCGMPNGTLHSHFCPVGRVVPRLEYAPEGTSRKLREAEAAIARVRALCSQSRAVVSRGCSCHADECSGKCGAGKPLAWDLDPADVLRALDGSNSPPVTSEIAGPLIDPDCRDGKHSSCVGGPCECSCHELAMRG